MTRARDQLALRYTQRHEEYQSELDDALDKVRENHAAQDEPAEQG